MSPDGLPTMLLAAPAEATSATGVQVAFWALALLTVGGALATITRRNAVSAVMALVATFFGLAGMYLLLSAEFLAAIQVLVYAGAIMTLFVFVVMVLNREEAEPWSMRNLVWKVIGVSAVIYLGVKGGQFLFSGVLKTAEGDVALSTPPGPTTPEFGGVADVGWVLFRDYLFPFEALSLMLLVAIIGAVVVARTPKKSFDDHAGGLSPHDGPTEHAAEGEGH